MELFIGKKLVTFLEAVGSAKIESPERGRPRNRNTAETNLNTEPVPVPTDVFNCSGSHLPGPSYLLWIRHVRYSGYHPKGGLYYIPVYKQLREENKEINAVACATGGARLSTVHVC